MTVNIQAMPTPNPNTIKFLLDIEFIPSGSIDFPNAEKAKNSPLPKALLEIEGMTGIMIGTNFVSITKDKDAGWENVLEKASNTIKEMVGTVDPLIADDLIEIALEQGEINGEIEQKIIAILDAEIRPAIAMDGGDCRLVGYKDGVVSLELQGACSSCPSATLTLKMGIEGRLKEDIPEIKEVVQVNT
jgi:Fe-S cluster biogenesis protein NfuA